MLCIPCEAEIKIYTHFIRLLEVDKRSCDCYISLLWGIAFNPLNCQEKRTRLNMIISNTNSLLTVLKWLIS